MSRLDPLLASCTRTKTGSKIKVEAHDRKAVFDNSARAEIKIVNLDCRLAGDTSPKADHIVSKPGVVDIVVELKGKDIDHALEQILATYAKWKIVPPISKQIGGLVVFSRSPDRSAGLEDKKKRFLQTYGIWLEMNKNNQTEYRFETFIGKKV
jgi:hypothetical protein